MKKGWARFLLMLFMLFYLQPLTVLAASETPPPVEPYEKVAAKQGNWYTNQLNYDGETHLIVGYKGSYKTTVDYPQMALSLKEKTRLTGIYVPYAGTEAGEVTLMLADGLGNLYLSIEGEPVLTGGLVEAGSGQGTEDSVQDVNMSYYFEPSESVVLPKGSYTMYLDGIQLPVDAFLVKGQNEAAYQRYLEDLRLWALGDEAAEVEEETLTFGNEGLRSNYETFLEGKPQSEAIAWQEAPMGYDAPSFTITGEYKLDELVLSTWNGGAGASPGRVSILDGDNKEVASFNAQGASQGTAANGMWVVMPGITLPAGTYTIAMDPADALDFDEVGEPGFHVGLSVPADPPMSFTGTYRIWLDLYKTHTLMGPVDSPESSFSLEDYQLSILDKGETIELMGQYEGMPFSQNCTVSERDDNHLVANFHFGADLTKLPYKAKIAAISEVTLTLEPNGRLAIGMAGQGFYTRAATAEKGADDNVYDLTLRGNRVKKDLPPFVMAAIARAYGAGNIPGPDSSAQVAVGILFPPLVGLVVHVLQGLLAPKEMESKLSVGEQAMKEANQSLGKGLYTEEEARAWKMVADALGASGGDPEDGVSIGDNELPGGEDYQGPTESSFAGRDDLGDPGYENEEDLSFGKPDAPKDKPDAPVSEPSVEYSEAVAIEPESMVVKTSARGAEALIVRDPETGGWVNAETGNPFDLDEHRRKFPQQVKDVKEFIEHNEELERTGQTGMQKALDEIARKEREEFNAIQKEINQRYREQLERNQKSLENQMEHANKLNNMGRIIGDSIVNAGDELVEAGKEVGKAAKEGLEITVEAAKMTARDLLVDQKKALENMNESYEYVKTTLENQKNRVVAKAEEIYNKPWIVVKGVMETGKAVVDTVTDPKKAWEWAKDTVGISDFEKSLDPNLSLVERFKKTFSGTMKLGVTIGTAGQAGAAIKGGAGKLVNLVDDVVGAGGKKLATKGTLVKGIKTTLPVKTGPNYVPLKKAPNVAGVTQTSRKIIQNTADDFGVRIKARPTTPQAEKWLNSGKAVPKEISMKAKTLDKWDELLGGPKDSEGLVGYYKPKLPPKEVMRRLSRETQEKLVEKYKSRRREYTRLSDTMKQYEQSGKYKVVGGRVLNSGGKVITGDVDIYDIVNFDGTPVAPKIKKQVLDHLTEGKGFTYKKGGSNVMHEDVISWSKDGIEFSEKARDALIEGAMDESKGVTSYNPMADPTAEKYVR